MNKIVLFAIFLFTLSSCALVKPTLRFDGCVLKADTPNAILYTCWIER